MTADELLVRCQARLLTRIRWMMGDRARRTAESGDVLGDLMAKILRDVESLTWRDEEHFLALATRIARNLIVDQVRRPRVRRFESFTANLSAGRLPDAGMESPSAHAQREEEIGGVLDALEALPGDYQLVIELRDLEGLSFAEVARELERTENAAQILHMRAVTALGRELRQRR